MLILGGVLTGAEGMMTVRMRGKDGKTGFRGVKIKSEGGPKVFCLMAKQK